MVVLGRGFWSRAVGSAALLGSLLGSVHEASACSPPPSGWFPSGSTPPPANGVVLLRYACYQNCATPPAVENLVLKDEADELVPGSVVFSQVRATDLVVAFRPEPGAVTAGGVYTAELEGVSTLEGILVGPAVTWNDALTLTEEIFEVDHPWGDIRCCPGPIDSCGDAPCFRTEVERRATVTVGWGEPLSIEQYQYAFRIGDGAIDPATPWSWDSGDTRFELGEAEDSVCYVLELKRLVDDSVQTFASRCVERPDSFTPGVHPTPDEDIAEVLAGCDGPPDGYEKAWCEARRDGCETSPDEPWCSEFAARCAMIGTGGAAGAPSVGGTAGNGGTTDRGGTSNGGTSNGGTSNGGTSNGGTSNGGTGPSGGSSGRGGSSARGGDAGDSNGGTTGEAGDEGESRRVVTEGCGCSVPGSRSRWPAGLALAFALVALRLRRAAQRRSHGSSSRLSKSRKV
jgi:MYXO-CTERM domain-containing protein